MTKERQECLELEMHVESMLIEVKEPPPIGNSRLICGNCHHRGHRNTGSQPCKMEKCMDYTYCGNKDKHPEYFSKLNSLKVELKKKKSALQEIEAQIKSMNDFTTSSEFSFVKNITPRMYAADPSYKVNKAKLMRDVRLLRTFLDGKIPAVTANDGEQLGILISKCKSKVGIPPDTNVDALASMNNTASGSVSDVSPIKQAEKDECLNQRRKKQKHKHKKQKKSKKVKRRRRERNTSSSDSEDDVRPKYTHNVNTGTFPCFNPGSNASYNFPIPYLNNPYFYSQPYNPSLNSVHVPYASYNTTNRGNMVSNSFDNHQVLNNNTNLFEDPSPLGSIDVRLTTTVTPPKSIENKRHGNEQGLWNSSNALPLLADAAIGQDK